MRVTQHPIFKRFWYPVIPSSHLADGQPHAFELLGQKLVLWLDEVGQVGVLGDRCCHRTALLSLGQVNNGAIQCPYHGWEFDTTGTCTHVPQLAPTATIPKTYCVPAFRCQERYGYVWVALAEPLFDIPHIPEADDPTFRQIHQFYEPWNTSGLRIMENSFDAAHGNFVHAASWGDQQNPIPPSVDDIRETRDGFVLKNQVAVLNPDIQKKNLGIQANTTLRTNTRQWFMPFCRTLKITYPNGLIHLIFTAATPVGDRTSQLVQFCLRNDTEADASTADIIAFDRQVTHEDQAVLEHTDWDSSLALSAEEHMPSDKPGILMRRRLAALLQTQTPAQSDEASHSAAVVWDCATRHPTTSA